MAAKAIEGSITKTSLKKLGLRRREYERAYTGGIKSNNGPTMIYLLLIRINPDMRIVVSNLKDEIERSTLAKFGNNMKDLLDDIYSNYSIIIDKGKRC